MNTQSKSLKYGKITWTDVVNVDEKTLLSLKKRFDFHELDLEDCLSDVQRSKIDDYEDYLFIVLHFPYYDKRRKRIVQEEVDIFIAQNQLITLHGGKLKAVHRLMEDFKKNRATKQQMGQGTGYLLYVIIRELFDDTFPLVDDMERSISGIERDLFEGDAEKDMVRDILWLKKDIITFRRIISPQRSVIAQLEHKNKKFLPEDLEVYFDDVVDKIEKIWSNLENLKELAEDLQDTNEVLISHQTNRVIKILTVFSVILLPLTLITGFYGMNVGLPFSGNETAVAGITTGMILLATFMLFFFKWKRWL
jgi:magnesium transporter